jgi:hypothetical protein
MRVAIASLELESVSFLPAVAEIADFHRNEATSANLVFVGASLIGVACTTKPTVWRRASGICLRLRHERPLPFSRVRFLHLASVRACLN